MSARRRFCALVRAAAHRNFRLLIIAYGLRLPLINAQAADVNLGSGSLENLDFRRCQEGMAALLWKSTSLR
jgi:hypothetical protein